MSVQPVPENIWVMSALSRRARCFTGDGLQHPYGQQLQQQVFGCCWALSLDSYQTDICGCGVTTGWLMDCYAIQVTMCCRRDAEQVPELYTGAVSCTHLVDGLQVYRCWAVEFQRQRTN